LTLPSAKARGFLFHRRLHAAHDLHRLHKRFPSRRGTPRAGVLSLLEVSGCVRVPIVERAALGTSPCACRQRQHFVLIGTNRTQLTRRKPPINEHGVAVIPACFVLDLTQQHSLRGIQNALGQLGSRTAFEVQGFAARSRMALHQSCRQFSECSHALYPHG
jgi:hypothetical protein